MIKQHIIISPDAMVCQLVTGILKKNGISSIINQDLLGKAHDISSTDIFLIDIIDDTQLSEGLWAKCLSSNILNQAVFIINSEHSLYNTIVSHCPAEQIIIKPVFPDKLYSAINTLSSEPEINQAEQPNNTREAFMKRALDISFEKMREEREAPFGAVIVKDNKIIAEGSSEVISQNDPTAHAEIVALRKAGKKLDHYYLRDCEIYTSTEPCPMCLAALYLAGIQKIYYANSQSDAEEFGFGRQNLYDEIAMVRDKRIMPYIRMMEDEAIYALEEWKNNFTSDGYNTIEG